jgi:DNA ligase-1
VAFVRQKQPHTGWLQLQFAIFDAPRHEGDFATRIAAASDWFIEHPTPYAFVIEQTPVADRTALQTELQRIEALGGEGLMVRNPQAPYRTGRSPELLKVKAWQDAEARVIEHLPGSGRNRERLGALLVERPDGMRLRVGGGFSDAERDNPPPLGTIITYKYFGTYPSGLPKFPTFLRIRRDQDL